VTVGMITHCTGGKNAGKGSVKCKSESDLHHPQLKPSWCNVSKNAQHKLTKTVYCYLVVNILN